MRATISAPPGGDVATMMRIGRDGQASPELVEAACPGPEEAVCAAAGGATPAKNASNRLRFHLSFIMTLSRRFQPRSARHFVKQD